MMSKFIFNDSERVVIESIGALNYVNPFLPERLELEREILNSGEDITNKVWNMNSSHHNIDDIATLAEFWSNELYHRLIKQNALPSPKDIHNYQALVLYHLFKKYGPQISTQSAPKTYRCYEDFSNDFTHYFELPFGSIAGDYTPEHTFAVYFQINRAFTQIFDFIAGGTLAAGRLRAAIWHSIFSCNIYRYHRILYKQMNEITTLIGGESGTGKELVARAIALSQYIPFSSKSCSFECNYESCFIPLQLSAMPQTMLESELFGHSKGSFTGALVDRVGYFESCSPYGSIFLDEIGEITPETQVKLLRVLQMKTFHRIGSTQSYEFKGKVIAATNRDLVQSCEEKTFREDLYYRLCSDVITTVPLRELLGGEVTELTHFVAVLAQRILGKDEAQNFAPTAVNWITKNLGIDYPWPGNVRELEQCVRNLLIRGNYAPTPVKESRVENLSANEVIKRHLQMLYTEYRNYSEVARVAQLDRRTVKKMLLIKPLK